MADYQVRIAYGQFEIAVSSPTPEWAEKQIASALEELPDMVDAEFVRAGLEVGEREADEGDGEGDGQ